MPDMRISPRRAVTLTKAALAGATAMAAIMVAAGSIPAHAAAIVPFTWDLSKASPSLGGGPFTADSISMTTFLYALAPPGGGNTPETFIIPDQRLQAWRDRCHAGRFGQRLRVVLER